MEKEGIPLVRLPVAAKGFLCGSLLAGSVAIPYGLPVQVLMLTLSIIMFLESIFAFGRSRSTLSFSAAMVVGMIALAAVALIRVIAEYLEGPSARIVKVP